jgi:hypothetical protein
MIEVKVREAADKGCAAPQKKWRLKDVIYATEDVFI